MTGFDSKRDASADKLQGTVANSFEEYCKTLHPLWNTHISRTYAEQFFRAGQSAQPAQEPFALAQPPLPVQPAQEPVARVSGTYGGRFVYDPINRAMVLPAGMALYAMPPKREWVGLTDEDGCAMPQAWWDGALWAEAKLKEKNT